MRTILLALVLSFSAPLWADVTGPISPIGGGGTLPTFPAGAIVGTTDTQTLTNKSISGSQINSGTVAAANQASCTINAQTGTTYTLVLGDANNCVTSSNASAQTITVPTNASVAFPIGTREYVQQIGAGGMTISPAGGVTFTNSFSSAATSIQYAQIALRKTATDTWNVDWIASGAPALASLTVTNSATAGRFIPNGTTVPANGMYQATGYGASISTATTLRGGWDTSGYLISKIANADQSYSLQVPTTGFSITIANGVGTLILNPAGTLATGTITMPSTPIDGQKVQITTSQTVTSLTVSANAGQSIVGAPSTLTAVAGAGFIYNLSGTTWYRAQ